MARIKHIEIAGVDGSRLGDFYRELFAWEVSCRDIAGFDYFDITTEGDPTAGIRHEPKGKAEIVVYVEVDDVEKSVERALELGASVRIPPMEHGELAFALVEDPEGNPIGLTQRTD